MPLARPMRPCRWFARASPLAIRPTRAAFAAYRGDRTFGRYADVWPLAAPWSRQLVRVMGRLSVDVAGGSTYGPLGPRPATSGQLLLGLSTARNRGRSMTYGVVYHLTGATKEQVRGIDRGSAPGRRQSARWARPSFMPPGRPRKVGPSSPSVTVRRVGRRSATRPSYPACSRASRASSSYANPQACYWR